MFQCKVCFRGFFYLLNFECFFISLYVHILFKKKTQARFLGVGVRNRLMCVSLLKEKKALTRDKLNLKLRLPAFLTLWDHQQAHPQAAKIFTNIHIYVYIHTYICIYASREQIKNSIFKGNCYIKKPGLNLLWVCLIMSSVCGCACYLLCNPTLIPITPSQPKILCLCRLCTVAHLWGLLC